MKAPGWPAAISYCQPHGEKWRALQTNITHSHCAVRIASLSKFSSTVLKIPLSLISTNRNLSALLNVGIECLKLEFSCFLKLWSNVSVKYIYMFSLFSPHGEDYCIGFILMYAIQLHWKNWNWWWDSVFLVCLSSNKAFESKIQWTKNERHVVSAHSVCL